MAFILIRAYTKLAIIRKVNWDDLTISLATLGAILLYVMAVLRKRSIPRLNAWLTLGAIHQRSRNVCGREAPMGRPIRRHPRNDK